jgi:ketosteroid isomerase-like protein
MPTEEEALAAIEASHHEWRCANLAGLLAQYTDDMVFWCNAGYPSGGPIEIKGKAAFRESLAAILRTTRCTSRIVNFNYSEGRARVLAEHRMHHIASGISLSGTYRQLISFKRGKIQRLEEYHDAARLAAFWKLTAEGACW